jgi:hypothetical protein
VPYAVGARLDRTFVRLGERVDYGGWIAGGGPARVRFLPPEPGGAFTWGTPSLRRAAGRRTLARPDSLGRYEFGGDTLSVSIPLQAFRLGELTIPGLRVEIDEGAGPHVGRLPTLRLLVVPVVPATDTSADLRPLRGPLAAPWWERVPWMKVGAAALVVAAVAAFLLLRRRTRAAVPAPAPQARRDPAADALAELAALRRLGLAAQGRFADHAFQLGRIVRRFLEATAGTPRPGDTTPEFVGHLEAARLEPGELRRLEVLMRGWDRVKFARAEASVEEARSAEDAVESLVRRLAPAPPGKAA